MDRTLYWNENQSRTFDYVQDAKDTLKALAQLMGDALGKTSTVVAGLAATANSPASLSINLAAGAIYQLADIDATANGAIAQDTTQVLQQGIIGAQSILLSTAGIAAGQSQWQLIECQFSQSDIIRAGDPNGGLLFFYNASNVSQPFQGPGGAGTTTPTVRQGLVTVQVISGAAATTGSEVPPQPTPGWTPLYIVDLSFGQTQITQAQIHAAAPSAGTGVPNTYPYAPFLTGLTNSHHGGVPGQAPKINLATEVSGILPLANMATVRTVLFANLTLYVNAATGNDSTGNGLTPNTAFQTVQRAVNEMYFRYDFNGWGCTIQVADGTYSVSPGVNNYAVTFDGIPIGMPPGGMTLNGNRNSPGNCVLSVSNGNGIVVEAGCYLNVAGFTISASGSNQGLLSALGYGVVCSQAWLNIWDCVIGACGSVQVNAENGGVITFNGANTMTLTGSNLFSLYAIAGAQIWIVAATVNVSGLSCSGAFCIASDCGIISAVGNTFIGSASGQRYQAALNGVIYTGGGGANYFPGSVAGATATGGQYV